MPQARAAHLPTAGRDETEMTTIPPHGLRHPTPLDRALAGLGRALASLAGAPPTSRPMPVRAAAPDHDEPTEPSQRRLSGALMRVNHVGEICAQALYEAQAASTVDPVLEGEFRRAAREEGDHLAWTRGRLRELGARPSALNPFWYAGSFAIGLRRVDIRFYDLPCRIQGRLRAGQVDRVMKR